MDRGRVEGRELKHGWPGAGAAGQAGACVYLQVTAGQGGGTEEHVRQHVLLMLLVGGPSGWLAHPAHNMVVWAVGVVLVQGVHGVLGGLAALQPRKGAREC